MRSTQRRMMVCLVIGENMLPLSEHVRIPGGTPANKPSKRSRKPWEAPRVKVLTEANIDQYSIFDVIMPLPGRDVSFPGSSLGERYKEFLKVDGLDPENFERKQKCVLVVLRKLWMSSEFRLQGIQPRRLVSQDSSFAQGTFMVCAPIHGPGRRTCAS